MKFFKLQPSKMIVCLLCCTSSISISSMIKRAVRPLRTFSSAAQIMIPTILSRKNSSSGISAHFIDLEGRFEINSYPIMTTKQCASHAAILDLYRKYEEELITGLNEDNKKGVNSFIGARIIHDNYKKKYAEQHEFLSKGIKEYHAQQYPLACKDLSINQNKYAIQETQTLCATYEDIYKDYTSYPDYPACMDSYYNIGKAINTVELHRQNLAPQVNLRNYIFDYIKQKNLYKRYVLDSVVFSDKRLDGDDMPIALYDPNIGELRFSLGYKTDFFNDQSKSVQALTLMHEIEHTCQSPWMHAIPAEREADLQSVKECNCPICLKIKQAMLKDVQYPAGYLTSYDFGWHAQQATNRCKAHSQHDTTELEIALERGDKNEIKKLDDAMGTIFDRLPKINVYR